MIKFRLQDLMWRLNTGKGTGSVLRILKAKPIHKVRFQPNLVEVSQKLILRELDF